MTRGKTGRDTAGTLIAEVEAARRTNPGEAWERLERGFAPAVRDAGEFRRGELWRLRGHVLRAIRRVREALVAYRRAERCFARAGDLREQGRCAMGLIEAYMYLGRYDDAEKAATLGRRRLQRAGDRLALARLLNNVGNLYHRRDRPDLALGCYRRAHGVMSRAGEARAAAVIENNVGNCLALLGRLGAARATYRRARVTHQRMGFPLDVLQADYGLAYLGFLELDHERALDALARVRLDARDHGVPALMALSVLDRAEILLRLGAHDDALEEAGTAIRECGGLKLGYETAKAETFAALAEYRSGRTHAARARLERTLAAFDAEGNRVWAGEALMGLATLAWDRRQALAAAALLAAAARCFAAARDTEREGCALALLVRARVAAGEPAAPALRRATALARSRGSSRLRHLVWSSSALVAGRHGRRAEARHALRRAALESERLAARILDEQWRASFWGDWGWPHEQLAELELAAGRVEPAFDALERGRGRTLLGRGGRALSRPVLEWAGAQDARDRERSRHAGPSAARPGGVRRTVRIPRALAAVPPASIRAATLRRTLGDHEALVDYALLGDRLVAIVLTREGAIAVHDLPGVHELRRLAQRLLFSLRSVALRAIALPDSPAQLAAALEELSASVLWPVLGALGDRALTRVTILPVAPLARVPWAALPLPDGRLVCEGLELTVTPGLRLGLARRALERHGGVPLIVASDAGGLSHVGAEIETLTRVLPGARVLAHAEATAERFLALAPEAGWIHFAGHGAHDHDRSGHTGLRLADRWVFAGELEGLRLRARGVTLSACHTARALVRPGEEWFGLTRTLMRAGVRAVVAAQWDVEDAATARLFGRFYERLAGSQPMGGALAATQAESGRAGESAFDWAGFVLLGGPDAARLGLNP